jgi:hypothetical protein
MSLGLCLLSSASTGLLHNLRDSFRIARLAAVIKFRVRADHGFVRFSPCLDLVFDKLGEGFYMYGLVYAPRNHQYPRQCLWLLPSPGPFPKPCTTIRCVGAEALLKFLRCELMAVLLPSSLCKTLFKMHQHRLRCAAVEILSINYCSSKQCVWPLLSIDERT